MKIGCLGPEGTFSHEAAFHRSEGADIVFYSSFTELIGAVGKEIDEAAVPINNLEMGGVYAGLDPIIHANGSVKVVGELVMPVKHHLIASEEVGLHDILRVRTKLEAAAQCIQWLRLKLPRAEIIETSSTSKGVKDLAIYNRTAAIGSEFAAKLYRRNILVRDIHDNPDNVTHFLYLASENCNEPTGNDKTSLVFSLRNIEGALYHAIAPFAVLGINMLKIESRPSKKGLNDSIFWVDIKGHVQDKAVSVALERMGSVTNSLTILGSYPQSA